MSAIAAVASATVIQVTYAGNDSASDPNIDHIVRPLLAELKKDPSPFW